MRGPFITMAAVLVVFTVLTHCRNEVWRGGSVAVWQDAVSKSPRKLRAHLNLGFALMDAKDFRRASAEFQTVLLLSQEPDVSERDRQAAQQLAGGNLGAVLIQLKLYPDASRVLVDTWNRYPGLPLAGMQLAYLAMLTGRPDDAIAVSNAALVHFAEFPAMPDYAKGTLLWNRAEAWRMKGRCVEALIDYTRARREDPELLNQDIPICHGGQLSNESLHPGVSETVIQDRHPAQPQQLPKP